MTASIQAGHRKERTVNAPLRQGDVYLVPATIPAKAASQPPREGGIVLAWGEVTGHAHRVLEAEATLLTTAENERFLRIVGGGASVVHEEHGAIAVPPGDYRVVIGREWTDDMAARPVVD